MTDRDDSASGVVPPEGASVPTEDEQSAKDAENNQTGLLDDATEADNAPAGNRYVRAGTLVFLAIIVSVTLIPPVTSLFRSAAPKPVEPKTNPGITVPISAPQSLPTGALQTPAAVAPESRFSVYDEKFLLLMRQDGWNCPDHSGAEQCKKQMVNFAHQICRYSGQTIDRVYADVAAPAFFAAGEERVAIAKAGQAYPNCTFRGTP